MLALCQAGIEDGHGQAVSSQSIVRHNEPTYQTTHNFSPVIEHAAPVYQQAYLQHGAPVVHANPLIQHLAPAAIHHAPVVQHITPVDIGRSEHVEEHVSTA